jgi:outer membrane protein TolC
MFIERIKITRLFVTPVLFLLTVFTAVDGRAQATTDSILQEANLPNIIDYALKKQPMIQQALADEKITALQIKSKLADWYPQINFDYLYQHNFQIQTNIIGGNPVRLGVNNTSAFQFSASQAIFNRDVLLANRTRGDVLLQSRQQTTSTRIDVVVNVSKAFYDVLATEQQIKVSDENILRLQKSLSDSRAQYDAGIVDKTDYKRATIALNNTVAARKGNIEALKAKTAYLKALMNYPEAAPLQISYDSTTLEKETMLDTLQIIDYSKRIEYQQLETQRKLLEANLKYNKWSYLPSLSANGAYNLNYQDNQFSKLYGQSFPNSYAGLTLSFPIFQGGKRKYNIEQAEWQLKKTDLQLVDFRNAVNSEYHAALANYKASLVNYMAIKENVALAQEVYEVIQLQYRSGIKTYLEVITAETDLRTSQINYFNALYDLLSSKIDVQRSFGDIRF